MSIIDNTYFTKTELKLPIDNINDIQDYIDEHEPCILKQILGYNLYKDFIDGLAVLPTPDIKWTNLRDGGEYTDTNGDLQEYEGIQTIIADYVFFKIVSNIQNYTTDSGVKKGITENAEIANPKYKQVAAWSDMLNRKFYLDGYITAANDANPGTYANYEEQTIGIANVLNI